MILALANKNNQPIILLLFSLPKLDCHRVDNKRKD